MTVSIVRILLVFAAFAVTTSASAEITTVDRVRVIDGRLAETLYYYENNWMVYRAAAKRAGVIRSYELLIDRNASDGEAALLLFTVYRDQQQYEAREANFTPIMNEASPSGPRLLNEVEPAEFRDVEYLGTFKTLHSPDDSP